MTIKPETGKVYHGVCIGHDPRLVGCEVFIRASKQENSCEVIFKDVRMRPRQELADKKLSPRTDEKLMFAWHQWPLSGVTVGKEWVPPKSQSSPKKGKLKK